MITSEASYLKSLRLLVNHFIKSQEFSIDSSDPVLDKHQASELFSNITEIVSVSERYLSISYLQKAGQQFVYEFRNISYEILSGSVRKYYRQIIAWRKN